MKILILSDIHANMPALRAVFADAPPCDMTICCGDLVGYYIYPNEVCDAVRGRSVFAIRGNHDTIVCAQHNCPPPHPAYKSDWTRAALSEGNLAWLRSLPVRMDFDIDGCQYTVRHASLTDEVTYLYPESPVTSKMQLDTNQWLICGHTHIPAMIQLASGRILNPGSVGQPRDYDPRASWALLDTVTQAVAFHRTAYDVAQLQNELGRCEWPQETIQILSRTERTV